MKTTKTVVYALKRNRFENPTKEEIIKNGDKFSLEDFEKLNNNGDLQCGKDSKYFISFSEELLPPDYNNLRREVAEWFYETFNFIDIDVLKKMSENGILEIEYPIELWIKEIFCYDLNDQERKNLLEEYFSEECIDEDDRNEFLELSDQDKISDREFIDWLLDNDKLESYIDDRKDDHYPIWNSCFEFREEPSELQIEVFRNKGLVIIERTDYFNTTIGVPGCGFDFYDAYWIPIYLDLPYNEDKKEYYKPLKDKYNN